MTGGRGESGSRVGFDLGTGRARLEEEPLHPGRAEDDDPPPRVRADVGTRVDDASGDVDGPARPEARPLAVDLDLELARDDVDRLRLVGVPVGR